MNTLVMGGTAFVGRAVVEACRARGDDITIFHRGRSMPRLFPDLEPVIGARDPGVDGLKGRMFDAVYDPGGFEVRHVRSVARLRRKRYVFVSSISVFSDLANMTESGPTHPLAD